MQNYYNRFENNRIEKGMFLEISKDRDIAMVEVETLGPKIDPSIDGAKKGIMLASDFRSSEVVIKRMELFEAIEQARGSSVLGKREHDGVEEK